jgi:hypothetical protein
VSEILRVTDDAGARRLAELLNGDTRKAPVVVVTTPAGRTTPYIDVEALADAIGDLAPVHLIDTGPHTWTFSRLMPEQTQVYGGAGRVYPVGHEWVRDVRRSPLRFAFDVAEGRRATRELEADVLAMAAGAGLLDRPAQKQDRRWVKGVVKGFPHPERAMVEVDRHLYTVSPELVVPGVPLERALRKGMTVEGWLDPAGLRLDLRQSLRPPDEALGSYTAGRVVLARVTEVGPDSARLQLHPSVTVAVARGDVTPNDLDALDSLMSAGEVVAARVARAGPAWALSMTDVDDEEEIEAPASLLVEGPPWLAPPVLENLGREPVRVGADQPATSDAVPELVLVEPTTTAAPAPADDHAAVGPRPTPKLLDRKRPGVPNTASTRPGRRALADLSLTVDALRADVRALKERVLTLESEQASLTNERNTLSRLHAEATRELARAHDELRRSRTKLRRASRSHATSGRSMPAFADPERGFRYAVETAWAERTPVGEQLASPLADYRVGPRFLDSLDQLDGVSRDKVANVVFEIVTHRAELSSGRDLHRLRESDTGGSPYVQRSDGATCWRAALQRGTPGARRLHFWRLADGGVELSRVVHHDDTDP